MPFDRSEKQEVTVNIFYVGFQKKGQLLLQLSFFCIVKMNGLKSVIYFTHLLQFVL